MTEADLDSWLAGDHGEGLPATRLTAGETVGDWRVEVYLGRGLSAEVYRVKHVKFGQSGALKLLTDPSRGLRERFLTESDAIRSLSLRVLPRFMGAGEVGGCPYYVMEYLQPLPDPMPRGEVAGFVNQVAKAVQTLHDCGYIHRDLKPGNIMRRANGEPVLIDLGLVKRRGVGVTDPVVRHGRGISLIDGKPVGVGTLDYAAPEQLLRGEASVQSDIFSLGKILERLYERRPPQNVKPVIRRATQAEPQDRFASADEFAAALRHRNRPFFVALGLAACAVVAVLAFPRLRPHIARVVNPILNPDVKPNAVSVAYRPGETDSDFFRRLFAEAEAGNVQAQIAIAEAMYYGRGTSTNRTEAFAWYLKAAEAGDAGAQASVGLCRFQGLGCGQDRVEAVRWYALASEKGDLAAKTNLAYCKMHGIGCERDREEALRLLRLAADCGYPRAQAMLGECYRAGVGVEPDAVQAELWLARAARNGDRRAVKLLGRKAPSP